MRHRFLTADVFTSTIFGGNQLAVFPDAPGIREERLLDITREFNYSETVFVYPPSSPEYTRRLRIFTPGGEVPFAGHPTVGTAHVLAAIGEVRLDGAETRIILEEKVGPVPVTIFAERGRPVRAQLSVAKLPEIGPPPPARERLADVLGLDAKELLGGAMAPQAVSCGLPFLFIPVRDRAAVAKARVRLDQWEATLGDYPSPEMFVFAMDPELPGSHVRARMFAPALSVPEDPATGSACAALGGYLAARESAREGTFRWVVEQGFEMGRPSILEIEADKRDGAIVAVRVAGSTVMVSEGTLGLGD